MRSHRFEAVATPQVMDHLVRRECARADRSGESFSLVLFRVGGKGGRRSMTVHRLARVILKRARLTDDVGWIGQQHLAAMLPNTTPEGARKFADGVAAIVAKHQTRPLAMVYSYPRDRVAIAEAGGSSAVASPQLAPLAAGTMKLNGTDYSSPHGNGKRTARSNGASQNFSARRISGFSSHAQDGSLAIASQPLDEVEESPVRYAADLETSADAGPRAHPSAAITWNPPVGGIEELLAYPMPLWKRAIDIIGATILLFFLAPVLAVAALAIKFTAPGPIMYLQRRSGLGGKPFTIFKLRTMVVNAEKLQQEMRKFNEQDGPAFKLTNDPRVTKVGAFLRKTSIDELPQLLNVIKGEMSLVGPRPLPIKEQEGCEQWQQHRLNVTPGLTCIWQVKGRSRVSFEDWVRMDVEYIRRRTIFHDMKILVSTVPSVVLRRGAK